MSVGFEVSECVTAPHYMHLDACGANPSDVVVGAHFQRVLVLHLAAEAPALLSANLHTLQGTQGYVWAPHMSVPGANRTSRGCCSPCVCLQVAFLRDCCIL
jgi:hypothetical protein